METGNRASAANLNASPWVRDDKTHPLLGEQP